MIQRTLLAATLSAMFASAAPGAAQTLSHSGDPGVLVVAIATAGAAPDPAAESTTTYTLSAVAAGARITGRLSSALPAGVSLRVTLGAPAGGASAGKIVLTTFEQDLVREIPAGSHAGLPISYELVAAASAGTLPMSSVAVTLTVVAPP